jgi:hypothetical protein
MLTCCLVHNYGAAPGFAQSNRANGKSQSSTANGKAGGHAANGHVVANGTPTSFSYSSNGTDGPEDAVGAYYSSEDAFK